MISGPLSYRVFRETGPRFGSTSGVIFLEQSQINTLVLQLMDNRLRQMAFFVFVKVGKWRISHYVEIFRTSL